MSDPASPGLLAATAAAFRDHGLTAAITALIGGFLALWIIAYGAVQALAESVPDSDGVVVVPAFTGLGAPHGMGTRGLPCWA